MFLWWTMNSDERSVQESIQQKTLIGKLVQT